MLILPTDRDRLPDPLSAVARLPRLWARGAPPLAVIVRERDGTKRAALAAELAPLCRARRVQLLVANDAALAARVRADGVHFSEAALRQRGIGGMRSGCRPRFMTAAAHSFPALVRAARLGVDGVLLSPVFATRSHPGVHPLGPMRFALLVRALRRRRRRIAVFALGGITEANALRLVQAGADGLAALGALTR